MEIHEDIQQAVQTAYALLIVGMRYRIGVFPSFVIFEKMCSYAKYYPLDEGVQWFVTASEKEREVFEKAWAVFRESL